MHPWITNCGKNPNTSIPKTQAHFRRFYRRNTTKRNTHYHLNPRAYKHSVTCHPHPLKTCEKCVDGTPKIGDESHQHHHDEETAKNTHISNLQPKRGKTGPEGAEVFRPNFLKLEKSFSFTALEDPEKYPEDDENYSDEDEKEEEIYKLTNEIKKFNLKPSSKDDEKICHKTEDWLADITNNNNNKPRNSSKFSIKKAEESNPPDLENKKIDGKENTEQQQQERVWLEKNIYNEPLKMQE
jgi:hypothetical protein